MMEKRGISSDCLKLTAVLSMLIDHAGCVLVLNCLFPILQARGTYESGYAYFYWLLRIIGRTAFPIYCYLLTEGFLYTRNRKRYGARLFLFALLSEIPFDLAFYGRITFSYQNVFFTLLFGYLAIWIVDWCRKNVSTAVVKGLLESLIVLFFGGLAFLFWTDYSFAGIVLIVCFYFFGQKKGWLTLFLFCLSAGLLDPAYFADGFVVELFAFPAFFLIANNNHVRKMRMKYFFYLFYPVHLLLLAAMAVGLEHIL